MCTSTRMNTSICSLVGLGIEPLRYTDRSLCYSISPHCYVFGDWNIIHISCIIHSNLIFIPKKVTKSSTQYGCFISSVFCANIPTVCVISWWNEARAHLKNWQFMSWEQSCTQCAAFASVAVNTLWKIRSGVVTVRVLTVGKQSEKWTGSQKIEWKWEA